MYIYIINMYIYLSSGVPKLAIPSWKHSAKPLSMPLRPHMYT